ncbi:hypothetical protein [Flaviaesturariibacter amylovorans]
MSRQPKPVPAGGALSLLLCLLSASILEAGYVYHPRWYQLLYITVPLQVLALLGERRRS